MGIVILLYLLVAVQQYDVPFKPAAEFELKTDHFFRRLEPDPTSPQLSRRGEEAVVRSGGPLPFLTVSVQVLKLHPEEERVQLVNNFGEQLFSRKARPGMTIAFEAGYTDDMKDRVKAHQYTLLFMRKDRQKTLSRIVIHVAEDGLLLVNGKKRGEL